MSESSQALKKSSYLNLRLADLGAGEATRVQLRGLQALAHVGADVARQYRVDLDVVRPPRGGVSLG